MKARAPPKGIIQMNARSKKIFIKVYFYGHTKKQCLYCPKITEITLWTYP